MSDALTAAQDQSRIARARLVDSLLTLRNRVSPGVLARDVKDSVVARTSEVAKIGADAVIDNKWTVAGAASLLGLFLARKPITALLVGKDETSDVPTRLSGEISSSLREKK